MYRGHTNLLYMDPRETIFQCYHLEKTRFIHYYVTNCIYRVLSEEYGAGKEKERHVLRGIGGVRIPGAQPQGDNTILTAVIISY